MKKVMVIFWGVLSVSLPVLLFAADLQTKATSSSEVITAVHIDVPRVYEKDAKGLYPDILREAFQFYPVTWIFRMAPSYARVIYAVNVEKSADVIMGVYQAELDEYAKGLNQKRKMACSLLYHDADRVVALFPKGKVPKDWKGKSSLFNKHLGWTNEYGYELYMFHGELEKQGGSFTEFNEIEKGLKMTQANRIYTYLMPYQEFIETSFKDQFEYRDVENLPLHFCFPGDARGMALKKQYEVGMTKMKSSGRLRALFQKWYPDGYYPY